MLIGFALTSGNVQQNIKLQPPAETFNLITSDGNTFLVSTGEVFEVNHN